MPRVRIVCISDTHGQHAKLSVPDGDILIHAGDFMAFGDTPKEIVDFNQCGAAWPLLSSHPTRNPAIFACLAWVLGLVIGVLALPVFSR